MTYNISADTTTFAGNDQRTYLEAVLEGIGNAHLNDNGVSNAQPVDVLALEELQNGNGGANAPTLASIVSSLNAKYGAGAYAYDTTTDLTTGGTGGGPSGLIYNTHSVQVLSAAPLGSASGSGAARAPMQYRLQPIGYDGTASFYLDVSHMKSGTDGTSANRRQVEATTLANNASALGSSAHIIAVGDFNLTGESSEAAYVTLRGQFHDPANPAGNWVSSSAFANLLSESATNVQYRDDIHFVSPAADYNSGAPGLRFIPGSLTVFGNGGSSSIYHHAITDGAANPNVLTDFTTSDRTKILADEAGLTDHLPVVADYSLIVPQIGTLSVTPASVTSGTSVTLTASGVTEIGGAINSVSFYRESNVTAGLQVGSDALVGTGAQSGSTWTLATSTSGLNAATHTYYAVAKDPSGSTSAAASTSLVVTSMPAIGSMSVSPGSVQSGVNATLSANNVTDAGGGAVTGVSFYRDTNGIAGLQVGSDLSVGSGTQSGSNWTVSASTAGLSAGSYTYFAQATDSFGVTSSVSLVTLIVTVPQPMVNLRILGSTNPDGPFSSSLSVSAGQSIYYQVVAQMAPVGSSNNGKTIASLTAHPIVSPVPTGYDGINSLSFSIADAGAFTGTFVSAALASNPTTGDDWTLGSSASVGIVTGAQVNSVRPILSAGVFAGAVAAEAVLIGSFNVPTGLTAGSTSSISGRFGTDGGGFEINANPSTGATTLPNRILIGPNDPQGYVSFTPLTLIAAASSLPPYISPSSDASYTWDAISGNLSVSAGTLTFTSDGINDSADPLVNLSATGSSTSILINTWQHLAGLSLSGGATADLKSVAGRSHGNHSVLVIGTVNGAAPVFSIDAIHGSKLDLEDNDLILHHTSYNNVFSAASIGRAGGAWTGSGLTSSKAALFNSANGGEHVALAVQPNDFTFLANPDATSFTDAGRTETLSADNDVIVKYTYVGDFNLDGRVNTLDASILGLGFDPLTTSGYTWGVGDTNFDGAVSTLDAAAFGAQYFGNGTEGSGLEWL